MTEAKKVAVVSISDADMSGYNSIHQLKHGVCSTGHLYLNTVLSIDAVHLTLHPCHLGFETNGSYITASKSIT